MRILASCARSEDGVLDLLRTGEYFEKLMFVVEEIYSEEIVANCLKVFRLGIQHNGSKDIVYSRYPNIANLFLFTMEKWRTSHAIVGEGMIGAKVAMDDIKRSNIYEDNLKNFIQKL